MSRLFLLIYFVGLTCALLSTVTIPYNLGVNIHWTSARKGEVELLSAGGFRFVRMDMHWGGVERVKGQYNFSDYDHLVYKNLIPNQLRALFIFDYTNKFYDQDMSPCSDDGRNAFANFADAAMARYKGLGYIWEIYNEPNIGFWKPKPNVEDYSKLVQTVGKLLKSKYPNETLIAPGTSQIDFPFIERIFQNGALNYLDAVSIHPYRQGDKWPETTTDDYNQLKELIHKYKPASKKEKYIPIIVSEWGYSELYPHCNKEIQGKYIARQYLNAIANDIPLMIYYDWHNDCNDKKDRECFFGTVEYEYHEGQTPCYNLKPNYIAARTLASELDGYSFSKNISTNNIEYKLKFQRNDGAVAYVIWNVNGTAQLHLTVSELRTCFQVTSYLGDKQSTLCSDDKGLIITQVSDTPLYLIKK
jgi:hypothetical protein